MKHLGDITKIHGDKIEPVDCITFGSPCQDLSIAGRRAGLAGERSGLFMEAVRIIKEMRSSTNGLYPTFAVWENVPGAFSSNGGEDFRAVLEELARVEQPDVSIPRPSSRGGRWSKAGAIDGNGWSLAWRQLDAQYWGVPQRRKRIALVADFGGQRASEILFEQTCLSRNPDSCVKAWKEVAGLAANGTAGNDRVVGNGCYCIAGNVVDRSETAGANGVGATENVSYTLNTVDRHAVAYSFDSLASNSMKSSNPYSGCREVELARTLDTSIPDPSKNQGGIAIVEPVAYTIKIRSGREGGGKGALVQTEKSATLSTLQDQTLFQPIPVLNDQGGIVMDVGYDVTGTLRAQEHGHQPIIFDARGNGDGRTCPTITGDHENRITDYTAIAVEHAGCLTPWDVQSRRIFSEYGKWPALYSGEGGGHGYVFTLRWIVRRLTPVECERLQGFPDNYTNIGDWTDSKGKKHKYADSPRYKALGNSIALPQWFWLVQRMRPYLKEKPTLGSLFDGLGGFPLVWQRAYGDGTARWASEIESFCVAVTKRRFGEE